MKFHFWKTNIAEIENDKLLYHYGFFLIFIHLVTSLFWYYQGFAAVLNPLNMSYCWPFFKSCEVVKTFLFPVASYLNPLYLLLGLVVLLKSLKSVHWMWWGLFSLEVVKLAFEFIDYQFMGNYHFMPHIVTVVFLLIPNKRFWVAIWSLCFYFGAASLKFNYEWLSGASLSWKIPFQNLMILQIGATLVVLIEIICPILVLQKEKFLKVTGLVVLGIFHVASYYWVGFFYPVVMICLNWFWVLGLSREINFELRSPPLDRKVIVPIILLALFWIFQFQAFFNPIGFALDGNKRLFSLNMFDARSECEGFFILHEGKDFFEVAFKNKHQAVRVKCDPIVFMEQGRRLCISGKGRVSSIEAYLSARRTSDFQNQLLVQEANVCQP